MRLAPALRGKKNPHRLVTTEMLKTPLASPLLIAQGVEASCGPVIAAFARAGDGIRTHDAQLGNWATNSSEQARKLFPIHTLRKNMSDCKPMQTILNTRSFL
jgi:hypothetical protein